MGRARRREVLPAALLVLVASTAGGQAAAFSGRVTPDSLAHGLAGATVSIPELGRSGITNDQGEFRITGLPGGRVAVLIRRINFHPVRDTVTFANGEEVRRQYRIAQAAVWMDHVEAPVLFDTVRIGARREESAMSPHMIEFNAHRKRGIGSFIDEAELRRNDGRTMTEVITGKLSLLQVYRPAPETRPGAEYLSSGCAGGPMMCGNSQAARAGRVTACPVTLYVNDELLFSTEIEKDTLNYPNFNRLLVRDYAGVEYYTGAGAMPEQYRQARSGCGVLVMWTREN